ncbi:Arm DNA-binding domain-containing protein [Mucilaginibacter agri]|uniref:Arm DNA-binding domain-containing protein n=1 Tax=Mucilaginibacter agri TaxID=2695265 RepID=A0A965ZGT7_9SPHI|nr:Arm DNA-binding domain-containing protein [Mucilaginibacter agri]NCD70740.1 hypothetical protein [Mucilaginibacter agri]
MKLCKRSGFISLLNPIYAAITVNKEKAFVALKQDISLEVWDFGKGGANCTREEARMINAYLDEVRLSLDNCYEGLLLKGKLVNTRAVKNAFLGQDDEAFTLNKLMTYHSGTAGKRLALRSLNITSLPSAT